MYMYISICIELLFQLSVAIFVEWLIRCGSTGIFGIIFQYCDSANERMRKKQMGQRFNGNPAQKLRIWLNCSTFCASDHGKWFPFFNAELAIISLTCPA